MKKIVIVSGTALALAGAFVLTETRAHAQRPSVLTLEGPGSWIGVSVRDTDADEASRAAANGVVVVDVNEGTPAARAGVKKDDVVVEFDGERARSVRQFTRLVRETAPGRSVKMTIVRDGSRQTLDITPEDRGAFALRLPDIVSNIRPDLIPRNAPRAWELNPFPGLPLQPRLGVSVTPLTDQLAEHFGVKEGVLVSEVAAGSPAETAGIKAGDVITTVNGHSVTTSADVVRELRGTTPGSTAEVRVMRDRREMTFNPKIPARESPVIGDGRPV